MGCRDNWKDGEIVDINNYYPFGLIHNYTMTTQNVYQYKYNGKELQETGMYDYGARFYMPDLGRWGVIDPLAENIEDGHHTTMLLITQLDLLILMDVA
jgi:RHS repeat-associated protein